MRIGKLKILAVAACVAVGLAGTGVMVAVSQEKKAGAPATPPDATKTAPKVEIKEPFDTAFPDVKAGDDCPRFMGKIPVRKGSADLLRRLAQERLDGLVKASILYQRLIGAGQWDMNSLFNLLQIRRDIPLAAADVFGPGDELVRWYSEWLVVTKDLEVILQKRFKDGTARLQDVNQTVAERYYAEHELLKVMARVKAGVK